MNFVLKATGDDPLAPFQIQARLAEPMLLSSVLKHLEALAKRNKVRRTTAGTWVRINALSSQKNH